MIQRLGLIFIILFLSSGLYTCTHSETVLSVRIWIVNLYSKDSSPSLKAINNGISVTLKEKLKQNEKKQYFLKVKDTRYLFDIKTLTLLSKKDAASNDLQTQQAQKALEKIKLKSPSANPMDKPVNITGKTINIFITTDANTLNYSMKYLKNQKNLSIVFCGVNTKSGKFQRPAENVTGVFEIPRVQNSLTLLKKIFPKRINSLSVLTDKSSTSQDFIKYLNTLHLSLKSIAVTRTDRFEEWQKAYKVIKADAVMIYRYHNLKDSKEKPVPPDKVLEWTVKNMTKPTLGFFYSSIEGGLLFGNVESGFIHGETAINMALKIVEGKKADEIPIISAKAGITIMNEKTAKRLKVDMKNVKRIKIIDKLIK